MPCHVSTLLYCFDRQDRVLLMLRAQEPNLGQWSPCGGKIRLEQGESPHAGAQREALEELELRVEFSDLHLTGIVTEKAQPGHPHWLMFLFEVLQPVGQLPKPHREGRFEFFNKIDLPNLPLPSTDRHHLWPLFWTHRGGFFAACCSLHEDGRQDWLLEATHPVSSHVRTATH